jgi:NDP-sugar pyrophosphorylase family protein
LEGRTAVKFCDFFTIDDAWEFGEQFLCEENPIFWLGKISFAIAAALKKNKRVARVPSGCHIGEYVFIDESVKLPPVCVVEGPAYIGAGTVIRPFAYVRENVIVGENCLIGNSCELKNSLLLNGVQVPHFNYVGDSILGNFSHLGAGAILANLRLDKKPITVHSGCEHIATNLRKFGAIVGDHVEIGCNSVINPGTALLPGTLVIDGKVLRVAR